MSDLISVIVPVYNVEAYLERCINSILNQTYNYFEVILVNDGSKDKSALICDKYAAQDTRVVVIHQENRGVSVARNVGLEQAKGQYIAFIDADDYVETDYLQHLHHSIIENKADISMCNYIEVSDGESKKKGEDVLGDRIYEGIEECLSLYIVGSSGVCNKPQYVQGVVWGKLILASLAKRHSFWVGQKSGEDTLYMMNLMEENIRVHIDDYEGYFYYRREGSATLGSAREDIEIELLKIWELFAFDSKKCGIGIERLKVNEYARKIYVALSRLLKSNNFKKYQGYRKELKKYILRVIGVRFVLPKIRLLLVIYLLSPELYWHTMRFCHRMKRWGDI